MGHQTIKQPDGNFCVWSSVVDDLILVDATAEDLEKYYGRKAYEDAVRNTREIIKKLNSDDKPYYQFSLTWKDVSERYKLIEGESENRSQ